MEYARQVLEIPLPFTGSLIVDTGGNGGVTVNGCDRADVLVRAQIQTSAAALEDAESLLGEVKVDARAGEVRAIGPPRQDGRNWSVSYEIFTPAATGLSVRTANGRIELSGLHGQIRFRTSNGPVALTALGGDVQGSTSNGSLSIVLAGDRWDGRQLDVCTSNGSIGVQVPYAYSAHVQVSTAMGKFTTNLSGLACRGVMGCELSFDLGSGGALVRAATSLGSISVNQTTESPQR